MSITTWILENEASIRLSFFFGVFILIALWEIYSPRRVLKLNKMRRWVNNIGLVFLNTIVVRLIFPAAAIGVAHYVNENSWGLLNYYQLPFWLSVAIAVICLDFIIYLQHVMVHAVPALWRLHRVHHADQDYDVTTGARFHPIEILLSMLIKFASIVVLGAPVVAVLIFEVILNALAMFNHGNIKLPQALDAFVRKLIVTPDMHRVHHSQEIHETNSNFGFNLSIWDRFFGTYKQDADLGQEGMQIGIKGFSNIEQTNRLFGMLSMPFITRRGKSEVEYAINGRPIKKK